MLDGTVLIRMKQQHVDDINLSTISIQREIKLTNVSVYSMHHFKFVPSEEQPNKLLIRSDFLSYILAIEICRIINLFNV